MFEWLRKNILRKPEPVPEVSDGYDYSKAKRAGHLAMTYTYHACEMVTSKLVNGEWSFYISGKTYTMDEMEVMVRDITG